MFAGVHGDDDHGPIFGANLEPSGDVIRNQLPRFLTIVPDGGSNLRIGEDQMSDLGGHLLRPT